MQIMAPLKTTIQQTTSIHSSTKTSHKAKRNRQIEAFQTTNSNEATLIGSRLSPAIKFLNVEADSKVELLKKMLLKYIMNLTTLSAIP